MEKFFYLGDPIGAKGGPFDSVITRIRRGCVNSEIFCPDGCATLDLGIGFLFRNLVLG